MSNYTEYQLSVIRSIAKEKEEKSMKKEELCTLTGVKIK